MACCVFQAQHQLDNTNMKQSSGGDHPSVLLPPLRAPCRHDGACRTGGQCSRGWMCSSSRADTGRICGVLESRIANLESRISDLCSLGVVCRPMKRLNPALSAVALEFLRRTDWRWHAFPQFRCVYDGHPQGTAEMETPGFSELYGTGCGARAHEFQHLRCGQSQIPQGSAATEAAVVS